MVKRAYCSRSFNWFKLENKRENFKRALKMKHYYILVLPVLVFFVIFHYIPMVGNIIAFKDYKISLGIYGSEWVGLGHFNRLFSNYLFGRILANTVIISFYKLIAGFPAPIILALLLNELKNNQFKKIVQTFSYLPHFISWVVLSGIIIEVLSPTRGVINYMIAFFGVEPIHFLASEDHFRGVLVITNIWKGVGWGSIVYLAAISGIDVQQFEASHIDGATRLQQIRYITLPSILPIISVLFILNLSDVLNAGFDQVFNLYNPAVYKVADIIDTFVYREGIENMNYSYATAVGLFKNLVGLVFVLGSNMLIKRTGENGLW